MVPSVDNARLLRRSELTKQAEGQESKEAQDAGSPVGFLASDAATTAAAATALVVGLFLVCAWVLKRGMPKSSRVLPREAVEILGRCPLGNKQFAHLIHVGNKVILVNVTASGAETLVEVDDPNEVVRILGVCTASGPGSASKEFDAIFQQFANEPAPKGFLGEESVGYSSAASAYSQTAQGGRRG
jgi:flagellar biogenesis protein FliO